MKNILKRTAVILMAFAMVLTMMPVLGALTDGAAGTQPAYAAKIPISADGFSIDVYDDGGSGSVWIMGYTGSKTELALPSSVTANGTTFKAWNESTKSMGNGAYIIDGDAFKGNTKITKIAVPNGYEGILSGAFQGCTGLVEVSIGHIEYESVGIGNGAFTGCTNLKTYNLDSTGLTDVAKDKIKNAGIGTDVNGNAIAGVTVWTQKDSVVWKAIEELNATRPSDKQIKLADSSDPYGRNTISGGGSSGGNSGGGSDGGSTNKDTKGEDGTAYGKGASESVVDAAILKYAKESDPKGAVFGLLQARLGKVTKNSLTLQWTKVKGAKKYVVYGNACGSKNKLKKLVKKTTKTKMVFKKVAGKKVAKGKYYKFMVVAVDKNNKVLSTSVIVHAATTGGKAGNDKAVKTKAKKDKVTIKKKKTFKLAAKAVPQSKKLKVSRHRGIKYETSNKSIATVSAKGVITGKKKGTCFVYAYAQNGVFKKIKVTVK